MKYSRQQIENAMHAKGYVWFESAKDYDLNIVGVRNDRTNNVTNIFDDTMTLSYKVDGQWVYHEWACTTDPGKKAMTTFENPVGVAILAPGQYRKSHAIGLHQGKYTALRQVGNVRVFRDGNKDQKFDMRGSFVGMFGINIHRSSPTGTSTYVENWSMGCQVFANIRDFEKFMSICRKAADTFTNSFSYTLLNASDL